MGLSAGAGLGRRLGEEEGGKPVDKKKALVSAQCVPRDENNNGRRDDFQRDLG